MKKKREVLTEDVCPACDAQAAEGEAADSTGPQNLSCEMRGMPRQRPNKETYFVIY